MISGGDTWGIEKKPAHNIDSGDNEINLTYQPQPPEAFSSDLVIPDASHKQTITFRTARTSSTVAPLLMAPFRCPFNLVIFHVSV